MPQNYYSKAILSVIPEYAVPYLTDGKIRPQKKVEIAGFWSGLESFASGVWEGTKKIGSGIQDALWGAGGAIKDGAVSFGKWFTDFGENTDAAIAKGATDATKELAERGQVLEEFYSAGDIVEEGGGLWNTIKNVAAGAWGRFTDLVKDVGPGLAGSYLKYELTKDIMEKKMEMEQKSREQARQEAEAEAQKRYNQTMAYVQRHQQEVAQRGLTPEQAANEILFRTRGQPPQPGAPVSTYLGVMGTDIVQLAKKYWYVGVGALLLILLLRK